MINVTVNGAVVSGTTGNDEISLRSDISSATITGGKGNDTIRASVSGTNFGGRVFNYVEGDGDDVIYGFTSNDALRIMAESFTTELSGNDVIARIGTGSVTFKDAAEMYLNIKTLLKNGTAGSDSISNVAHGMILNGLAGNDSITNSGARVSISGGAGSDKISNSGEYVKIDAGDGDDTVSSTEYYSSISGGGGNDSIYNLYGYATIDGGAGDDVIKNDYNGFYSKISGGDGNDSISSSREGVTIDGGSGDDTVSASGNSNLILGGSGNDSISVSGSSGTVSGGTGDDTITASGTFGRIFQYAQGDGSDVITGFSANDTLVISSGDFTTQKSGTDLIISVGAGSITLKDKAASQVKIKNSSGALTVLNQVIERTGTPDADSVSNEIHGLQFPIAGFEGNDTITNSGNNITLSGDEGSDKIFNSGSSVSISGGADNDTISNTGSSSTIFSGAGNDSIYNYASYVTIDAGAGDDTIYGYYSYSSKIYGGAGHDSIYSSGNYATIDGGDGNDTISSYDYYGSVSGGAGNDSISVGENYGTINGGTGDDTISASGTYGKLFQYAQGDGNDLITGFTSNDTLQITSGEYTTQKSGADLIISVGNGKITLKDAARPYSKVQILKPDHTLDIINSWSEMKGTGSADTLDNVAHRVTVSGNGGADSISNSGTNVLISGGDGNDTVTNNGGYSTILGGAGNDSIYNSASSVVVDGGDGNDTIYSSYNYYGKISGGVGNDSIYSYGYYSTVDGGAGDDTIFSYDYYGGLVNGGAGNDVISLSSSSSGVSTIIGGAGNDTIRAEGTFGRLYKYSIGDGSDVIFGFGENDSIHIASEKYNALVSGTDVILEVDGGKITLKDAAGKVANVKAVLKKGTSNNDSMTNAEADIVIDVAGGNDTVENSGANVSISGGSGNDFIKNSGYSVTVDAGDGNDTIQNYGGNSLLEGGSGDDSIQNFASNVTINGGDGSDTISSSYQTTINGGDGADFISAYGFIDGGAGSDKISVTGSGSTILGGTGNDTITASAHGNLYKYAAGDGDDVIYGFNLNDTLQITKGTFTTQKSGSDFIVKVGSGTITLKDALANKYDKIPMIDENGNFVTGNDWKLMEGTEGNDTLENIAGSVTVSGLGGNDSISNSGRYVTISGGSGEDTISNSGGNVSISGGEGSDKIFSSGYNSEILGGAGEDTISNSGSYASIAGGADNDSIYNSGSYSTILGGDGSDSISNYGYNVSISGGEGNDKIFNETGYATIDGGAGDDEINAYNYSGEIFGGSGNDKITLRSGSTGNTINGGLGDDTISVQHNSSYGVVYEYSNGDGSDLIQGVTANDTLKITGSFISSSVKSGSNLILKIGSGEITLKGAAPTIIAPEKPSVISGTELADEIYNTIPAVLIDALAGDDTVTNSADSVMVDAGAGDDSIQNNFGYNVTISGGAGSDTIENVRGRNVSISGGDGADFISTANVTLDNKAYFSSGVTINGGAGDDTIRLGNEANLIQYNVGDGNDVIFGMKANDTIQIVGGQYKMSTVKNDVILSVGDDSITLKSAVDFEIDGEEILDDAPSTLTGTAKADNLTNSKNNAFIDALKGNDTITNSGSNVTIKGGDGADKIYNSGSSNVYQYASGDGKDIIEGFAADDTLKITSGKYSYSWSGDDLVVKVGAGTITLKDAAENDFVTLVNASGVVETVSAPIAPPGGWKWNNNFGTAIKSSVNAPDDVDLTEDYGEGVVTVDGSAAASAFEVLGNEENNVIKGGKGDDYLDGGEGNDTLVGGAGDDTLDGGDGDDSLTGGNGSDVFICNGGYDTISDYKVGQDTIQVASYIDIDSDIKTVGKNVIFETSEGRITVQNAKGKENQIIIVDEDGNQRYPKLPLTLPGGWAWDSKVDTKIVAVSVAAEDIDLTEENDDGEVYGEGVTIVDGAKTKNGVTIIGNDLDNSLKGGAGADTLDGGDGDDTLTGGNGKDVFVYNGGYDVITDYKAGQDTIQVDTENVDWSGVEVSVSGTDVIFKTSSGNLTVKGAKTFAAVTVTNEEGDQIWPVPLPDGWSWDTKSNKKITVSKKKSAADDVDLTEENEYGFAYGAGVVTVDGSNTVSDISILGNDENNVLIGGSGSNTLDGGEGDDTLTGGANADVFVFNGGADYITNYKSGQDTIQVDTTAVDRDALKISTVGKNVVLTFGEENSLTIKGIKESELFVVDEDNNQWIPEPLPTLPEGWEYANGDSTEIIASETDAEDIDLLESEYGENIVKVDSYKVERDLTVIGNDLGNHIITGKGDDTIQTGSGDDTLYGGSGNDLFIYDGGNDVIEDLEDNDVVMIDTQTTTIEEVETLKSGDVVVETDKGKITLEGARGKDFVIVNTDWEIIYPDPTDTLPAGLESYTGELGKGIRIDDPDEFTEDKIDLTESYGKNFVEVDASNANEGLIIIGNELDNSLKGGKGDDTIYGGGDDSLIGGTGKDLFIYKGGNVVIEDYDYRTDKDKIQIDTSVIKAKNVSIRTEGSDLIYSTPKGELTVRNGADKQVIVADEKGKRLVKLQWPGIIELPYGWKFNNTDNTVIKATLASAEDIDLTAENDDGIVYGEGVVTVDGSKVTRNNFSVTGNELNNSISGGKGTDYLFGAEGDDYLLGNSGDDTLSGGDGDDTLKGGAGNDLFVYDGGDDFIVDYTFKAKERDTIQIDTSKVEIERAAVVGSNVVIYTSEEFEDETVTGTLTIKNAKTVKDSIQLLNAEGNEINISELYRVSGSSGAAANDLFADNNFISGTAQISDISEITPTNYSVGQISANNFENLAADENPALVYASDK